VADGSLGIAPTGSPITTLRGSVVRQSPNARVWLHGARFPISSGFTPARLARSWVSPHLTRRRYPERQDCWHVYYGDVQIGTIARRTGRPVDDEQFGWHSGFYPGMKPGQNRSSTAIDFDHAR
jgi:hypothetical protein